MTVEIALKRAYSAANPDIDGYRILVDRLWPRGLSKESAELNEWDKAIAPTPELRKWWGHDRARYGEFADRYREELDGNPEVAHFIDLMKEHTDGRITLVYAAKDPVINHAHILRNYLIEATTEKVEPIINPSGFKISTIPAKPTKRDSAHGGEKEPDLHGLNFRRLTVDDALDLQWVSAVTFEDTFLLTATPRDNDDFVGDAFTLEAMKSELANEKMIHYGLVDEDSGEIAAFIKVNLMGAQTEDGPEIPQNSLEIQRFYVMPRFKRRGLGSYLMRKALDIANEHECDWAWLGVWQYNFAAQQFYENWGFERFSQHVFAVGDDPQIDFLLKKKLK